MKGIIYEIVRCSQVALTTREICCLLNGVDKSYCLNVDGKGSRCIWWFRRPRHEKQRIKLAKPICRYNPLSLYRHLNYLVKLGLVKRIELYLRDPLSTWGKDRHVLYYTTEEQLYKRFKSKPLICHEVEYSTSR